MSTYSLAVLNIIKTCVCFTMDHHGNNSLDGNFGKYHGKIINTINQTPEQYGKLSLMALKDILYLVLPYCKSHCIEIVKITIKGIQNDINTEIVSGKWYPSSDMDALILENKELESNQKKFTTIIKSQTDTVIRHIAEEEKLKKQLQENQAVIDKNKELESTKEKLIAENKELKATQQRISLQNIHLEAELEKQKIAFNNCVDLDAKIENMKKIISEL